MYGLEYQEGAAQWHPSIVNVGGGGHMTHLPANAAGAILCR